MTGPASASRLRAYLVFLSAILYYFLARALARQAAPGWARDGWIPLVEQLIFAVLLLAGYALIGRWVYSQSHAFAAQGFPFRSGWLREVRLGTALGWGIAVVCVLPLTVIGGIAIRLNLHPSAWLWWFADLLFFAAAALVEEVAFRGYGFQCLEKSVGAAGAVIVFAVFYTILQALQPGAAAASIAVSLVFSVLLSIAYLRTRALWLSWGINFAWHASRAVLFGLVVGGISTHSSVVQSDPMGPWWLSGDGYGLDASWFALVVLLLSFPVVYNLTRDLDFEHNALVIVPGGIAVDLDAAAHRQHENALGTATSTEPHLVQIVGIPVSSSTTGAAAPNASAPSADGTVN